MMNLMHGFKAMLLGDIESLRYRLRAIAPYERGMLGQIMSVQYAYLQAIAAGWPLVKGLKMSRSEVRTLRKALKKFRAWEHHQKDTFHATRVIVEALLAGAEGRPEELFSGLERASAAARRTGNLMLALEASLLLSRLDDTRKPEANDIATELGAEAFISVIQGRRQPAEQLSTTLSKPSTHSSSILDSAELEVASIAKTSTAISTEIDTESLHQRLLKILVENVGASHAFIATPKEEKMMVVAQYGYKVEPSSQDGIDLSTYQECCHPMIREALRTHHPVTVDNAQLSEYRDDSHVASTGVRSIMAFPVVYQGNVACVFYLEHASLTGAFTSERERFLGLLAGQIAVSLGNARLYKEQASTLEAAERFIPREFLDALGITSIRDVRLGDAVNVPLTVLFADIRRFTSLSEQLSVSDTFDFLNDYLAAVTPAIQKNHGFIDKYIGDAVMALFPRDPSHAVRAALVMMERLEELNAKIAETDTVHGILEIGVGIHVGEVMLGTVGSEHRMDTTVIGDTVNIAARLEELTKRSDTTIIVSEDIRTFLPHDLVTVTDLGVETIRGRTAPLQIHGLKLLPRKE